MHGAKKSGHNGRKSKGIRPQLSECRLPPSVRNQPRPLPPSRGEAASSKSEFGLHIVCNFGGRKLPSDASFPDFVTVAKENPKSYVAGCLQ